MDVPHPEVREILLKHSVSNGGNRGPLVARPRGDILHAPSFRWVRSSYDNDANVHKDLKTTMRYIRAVQSQRNVRSQNSVHKLATRKNYHKFIHTSDVGSRPPLCRIRLSAKNVSYCLFESCSHPRDFQGFSGSLPSLPSRIRLVLLFLVTYWSLGFWGGPRGLLIGQIKPTCQQDLRTTNRLAKSGLRSKQTSRPRCALYADGKLRRATYLY